MARTWTPAQTAAIEIKNKTLLVSAAAGSGKTTTLTERIIRSITDKDSPADISKMLIVTFTRASAADLKSKIFSALNDALAENPSDKHLNSQLVKLGSARICTIDSFYLELLRSNFSELGLSPSFRIADTAEIDILSRLIMDDTIEFFYETDNGFPAFCECFTGLRNSDALANVLVSLASSLKSIPEGIEFLRMNAEQTESEAELDFFSTRYGSVLKSQTADAVRHYLNVFTSGCEYLAGDEKAAKAYLASFEYQRDFCQRLLDAIECSEFGYKDAKAMLESYTPPKATALKAEFTTPETAAYKELRKDITDELRALMKKSFSKSQETISRAMHDTAKYALKLYEVLTEFTVRLDEEKRRRNFLDFGDIRRYTLQLLVNVDGSPTPAALKYAEGFSHIYIDEYQDVDKVQDLIFSAISKPDNRFMVGDIKQSIYSFRGAEPQVFSDYRSAFPSHTAPEAKSSTVATIFMSENFRCDKNVIDFTNLVCSYIFSVCEKSIGYQKSDDLVFSKPFANQEYISPKTQVSVVTLPKKSAELDFSDEEMPDTKTAEARYIASEINRLITTEKKANGERILPGDIAVLFRARSMGAYLSEELRKYGILSSENNSDKYFENPDVLMMLCILNTVDNPQRDIFLAGALRSPIFDFTMDDLIKIRRSCSPSFSLYDALVVYSKSDDALLAPKCNRFVSTLEEWRDNARAMSVDKFLRFLFDSDAFVATGLLSAPTEKNGGNLLRLYEYARNFENGSFKGLYQFIEFINTLIEEGEKLESPPMSMSPDRVSLMTIHQSKGLEFPVCFVCGTASKFNTQEQKESLLFEYPLGVAMKISDTDGLARINTPMRESILQSNKIKQTEEEMRVLYVALTRARERLYVTAATKRDEEALLASAQKRALFGGRHTIIGCTSYLDWILTALSSASNEESYTLSFVNCLDNKAQDLEQSKNAEEIIESKSAGENEDLHKFLKEKFAFNYPYADFKRIPAKISVSRLSPDVLDESDFSSPLFVEEDYKKATVPDFFISGKVNQASATERGTATHLFLQFCDFKNAMTSGVKNELARLLEMKFIPQNASKLIFMEELERFFESDLITEILEAKRVIREQRFNILLPAEKFTVNKDFSKRLEGESLAVQGVIDLILIDKNGNINLYDYKTDRLTRDELAKDELALEKMKQSHSLQLSYYATAAEAIFERPCNKLCVYSTHAAKLFEIEATPLSFPNSVDIL